MKGWQLFYWHVSIILFAMATVHSLWQPLRLMTHWAWTIRIRKHVQTDPHGAKSSIPTGPSSCPEQCGRPWDIQYIFPCLHPTFTTYIIIYIYVCVCLIFKKFQDLASPTPMDHHILSYYHILLYILSYMIIYDRIIYDHHFLPIFRVAIIEDIPDPLWQSFGMAVWSPSHWHTTDASLAGPLPWNWEMGRVLKGPKVSLGPKGC
jgi:hypothetical protein